MAEKTVYIIDLNDKVTPKLRGVQQAANATDKSFMNLGNAFSAGGLAAGAGLAAVGAIAKGIWDITSGAEQTKTAFGVMLGSTDKATAMIKDIREFAAATPFETSDLEQSAKTLMGFGVEGEKVMGMMKMLGDVAMGDSDRFQRLSLVFAQTQAAGKLMGQDLLQYINAGFNPLKELSKQTGIGIGKLKDMMSEGMISADMVNAAFKSATSEGGTYFEMMQKQSQTLNGKLSTLVDNVKLLGLGFGEEGTGFAHGFLDFLLNIGDYLRPLAFMADYFFKPWTEFFAMMGFGGGGAGDGFLVFMKSLATVLFVVLSAINLVVQTLATLLDLLNSIIALDFTGFGDRLSKRFGNFDEGLSAIWADPKGKSMDGKVAMDAFSGGFGEKGIDKFSGLSTGFLDKLRDKDEFSALTKMGESFGVKGTKGAKGSKGGKETAGGITLNESKAGVTHIIFNIDKFQNNEFNEGKDTNVPSDIQQFMDKMAIGLNNVLNNTQIALQG